MTIKTIKTLIDQTTKTQLVSSLRGIRRIMVGNQEVILAVKGGELLCRILPSNKIHKI